MNKIWTFIIVFSFIFSIITNNFNNLINSLFEVPKNAIELLISIGSLIIIYNGIFQICIDCKLIYYISKLFKPILKKTLNINNDDTLDLLCANFAANFLGLGMASTPIAIKTAKTIESEKIFNKFICINTSCFCILPFTIITLREKLNGVNNLKIWIFLIIITFLSTVFGIIICTLGDRK